MRRSILWSAFVCFLLATLTCPSLGQTILPSSTIINWTESSCRGWAGFEARYGKFYGVVEGGLVIGSIETGAYTVLTTTRGLPMTSVQKAYIDDTGLIWTCCSVREGRLPWLAFDGLRWVGVGDIGRFGVLDNRGGIWTQYTNDLAHYRLSPPGWPDCIHYDAGDFGFARWPWWCGVDSSGSLWGTQFGESMSDAPRIYSFDGHELKVYYTPVDFRPSGGAVDRFGNRWFMGWPGHPPRIGRFDGETWEIWDSEDGLPVDQSWRWQRFAFDERRHPWVLGYYYESYLVVDTCITHFDGSRWQDVGLPDSADFSLSNIASDEEGTLFAFGSLGRASAVFRLSDGGWQGPMTIAGPVTSSGLSSVFEVGVDRQDGVWFACNYYSDAIHDWGTLITHLGSEGYTVFDDFRDANAFWCLKVDNANNKWFGGGRLVVTQDMEDGYLACTPPHGLRDIAFGPDGTVYVACVGYLYKIRDGEVTADELPWCNGLVRDVAVGSDGTVYLAFGAGNTPFDFKGGIYSNSGEGWNNIPVSVDHPLPPKEGWPIWGVALDDSGRLWADVAGSLAVFERSHWHVIEHDGETIFGSPGVHGPLTFDSHGDLWFFGFVYDQGYGGDPTRWGLCRFDGSRFTVWSQDDGILPDLLDYKDNLSNRAGAVSEDQYGNIWAAGEGVSLLLAEESLVLGPSALCSEAPRAKMMSQVGSQLRLSTGFRYMAPSTSVDLYVALQAPSGQLFYVAPQEAAPPFPIFYAAFDGSTEFLQPGPSYTGPGSIPNTPDMKDLAPPPLPLPDPPDGNGPTGLALFAYPVPYYANVPLPAYGAIADLVLLNTTLPEQAPAGAYTFHVGLTGPFSIRNVYRSASCPFEVSAE
ncbi:MAG TPA: hypothetical protein VM163_09090 [bacterium]|nr:hypothetical protein [bacterium]